MNNKFNINSLIQLVSLHLKTFFREPGILFWALGFPVVMAWILGIAFSGTKETKASIMMVNATNEASSRLTEKVIGEDIYNPSRLKILQGNYNEAITAMRRGEIELFIELRKDSMVFHYDPMDPDAAKVYLMLEREFSKNEIVRRKSKVEPLVTTGNRYIDFLIPGLLALGIMNSCVWGIGWSLIEMRMKKLLRRMVATPMKKSVFMLSHFIARMFLCVFEALVLLLFARLYFDIRIEGSMFAFILIFLSGMIAFSGIAVLMAAKVANSQIGNGLVNAITLPMMILSGIFFSYQNFPEWVLPVIKILPLTTLADSLRFIFTEGAGIGKIWIHSLVLIVEGVGCYLIGLRIYKWY